MTTTLTISLAQNVHWFKETIKRILSMGMHECKFSDLPADPLKPSDLVVVSLGTPEYKLFQNGKTRIILMNENWSTDLSRIDLSGVVLILDPKTGLNIRNKIGNIPDLYFPLWGKLYYSSIQSNTKKDDTTEKRKFGVATENDNKIAHILSQTIKKKCNQEIEYKKDFKEIEQSDSTYYFIFIIESTKCRGFVSDQLLKAKMLFPKMIPVYWGAPDVHSYFNSKSFINVSDFGNYEALADHLSSVITNEKIYSEYISCSSYLTEQAVSSVSPLILEKTFQKVLPGLKKEKPFIVQSRKELPKPKEETTIRLPQINKTFKDLVLEQKKIEAEDKQYMYPKLSKTIEPPTIITKQAKLYGTRKDQQPRKVGC